MQNFMNSKLTKNEIERFPRQIILPEITVEGQLKLRNTSVLIIGLGGLGAPVLSYLINTGIKNIGAIDKDKVEIHNLQRQTIYKESQIGLSKASYAAEFVKERNSDIIFNSYEDEITTKNLDYYLSKYEIIVDCTDDINCRYFVSEYCEQNNKNLVIGAVLRWCGHVFVLPAGSACYRCLFEEKKSIVESCDEAGVIGSVCGIIGSIQATEVLKVALGKTVSEMIIFDAKNNEMKKIKLRERVNHGYEEVVIPKKAVVNIENEFIIEWKEYFKNTEVFSVVDVRRKILFEMFNLKNSVNVTVSDLEKYEFDINKKFLLVCNKGITATKAFKILKNRGLDCYVAKGGYEMLFRLYKDFE